MRLGGALRLTKPQRRDAETQRRREKSIAEHFGVGDHDESFSTIGVLCDLCVLCASALKLNSTMKLLTCPINGLRPVSEFAYGGEIP